MDYQSNSKKSEEKDLVPDKKVEKVVTAEVIVQKKTVGQKVKGLVRDADLGNVIRYIGTDVLLPAFQNMIVDASTEGIKRAMYGERARPPSRGRGRPHTTYNTTSTRDSPIDYGRRPAHVPQRSSRQSREDFITSTRGEAEMVLERMTDIIDSYDVVSVADLNDMVGHKASYVDNKWGWTSLSGANVQQIREGYLINLPGAEPI